MVARHGLVLTMLVGLAAAAMASSVAVADPPDLLRNYRFITSKSTVDVTSSTGNDMPLNILGRFGLVTGYNYDTGGPTAQSPSIEPFAQFTDVEAILYDPRRATPLPSPGWDLDKTLNLSGLTGTFSVPDDLFFLGADGQGQAIRLQATITGPLLHLTGGSSDPCCNFDRYAVDAWAHQLPWADFNGNGLVDAADYATWQQSVGKSVTAGGEGDANGDGIVDAADYTIWRDELGETDGMAMAAGLASNVVPEPASMALLVVGTLSVSITMGARCKRRG